MYQATENVGPLRVDPFALNSIIHSMYEHAGLATRSANSREKITAEFKTMTVDFASWYDFSHFFNEHTELGDPHKMELTVRSSHDAPVSYMSLTIKEDFNHLYVNGNDAHAVAVAFKQIKAAAHKYRPWYARFRLPSMFMAQLAIFLGWVLSCVFFATLSSIFSLDSVFYNIYVGLSLILTGCLFFRNLFHNPWFPYTKISLASKKTCK